MFQMTGTIIVILGKDVKSGKGMQYYCYKMNSCLRLLFKLQPRSYQ